VPPAPRILAVDDEADLLATYERLLRRQGYEVTPVGTRLAALYAVRARPPDLLIADIRLADGDGLDVVRAVRAVAPPRPAVVVSSLATNAAREAALAAGATAFVPKPFSTARLSDLVRELLEQRPGHHPAP
jgi:DNA-binding response OmpR family regulator